MKAIVHDFHERLEWSQALSDEPQWVAYYRRIWPDAVYILRGDGDGQWQRWGVDRRITLPSGRDVFIDEKKRDGTWVDVLLEEWSVWHGDGDRRNKVGWTLDRSKRVDYIAYATPKIGRCLLLPAELLRLAYEANKAQWHELRDEHGRKTYPKDSRNKGYVTRNCPVPWGTLRQAMTQQMNRKYGDEVALPLPSWTPTTQQLTFTYTTETESSHVACGE